MLLLREDKSTTKYHKIKTVLDATERLESNVTPSCGIFGRYVCRKDHLWLSKFIFVADYSEFGVLAYVYSTDLWLGYYSNNTSITCDKVHCTLCSVHANVIMPWRNNNSFLNFLHTAHIWTICLNEQSGRWCILYCSKICIIRRPKPYPIISTE